MPGSVDRPPNFINEWRGLKAKIAELERSGMHGAKNAPWQTPTLTGGFTNIGGNYAPVGYYIDDIGRVYLRGAVNHGSGIGAGATIFTLAAGYRPAYEHIFYVAAEAASGDVSQWVSVNTDGTVVAEQAGAEGGHMWLDNVQFRTT